MAEKRLNIRIDEEDLEKLEELRTVLCLRSDSEAVRTLIRMHWSAEKAAVRRLRRLREAQRRG